MISKDASVVGQTLVNFISAQLKETWHLVESVDKTTESGSRWAEAVKGIFLLLTERIPFYPFVVARG